MKSPGMTPARYFLAIPCVLIFAFFISALLAYPGQGYIYVLFSLASNALLYFAFRRSAIFFDTFIGVFFWLGFWLKLTVRVAFMDSQFHEPVGNFSGTGAEFDKALLVATCGFLGLLVASYLRERYMFIYPGKQERIAHVGLYNLYQKHRKTILLLFVLSFVAVAVTNLYFGIYQRGAVPRTSLPYGIGGIYAWLLLFGLASISAMVLHFESSLMKQTTYLVAIISIIESFLSNVSLLSRGMILNTSALAYGVLKNIKYSTLKTDYRFWAATLAIFIVLFGCSIILVNHIRTGESYEAFYRNVAGNSYMTKPLFIDRWVGIEGVMAVSSYPGQGWKLWGEAWKETYSQSITSFYDTNIITSPYTNMDATKYHYISLPGILAFCFYPNSFLFLFTCMLLLGLLAAAVEISVFKLGGGNIIFCALLAQVVAYRYAHFGYVPGQSYLLFGALYLNILIIYSSNKFTLNWNNRAVKRAHLNP
jgi:hypothetical protein